MLHTLGKTPDTPANRQRKNLSELSVQVEISLLGTITDTTEVGL